MRLLSYQSSMCSIVKSYSIDIILQNHLLVTGVHNRCNMQELHTLPENLSSPVVFCGVRVARSLVFCVVFCRSLFVILYFLFWPLCCLFFFDTDSDYSFGIFKLFLIKPALISVHYNHYWSIS